MVVGRSENPLASQMTLRTLLSLVVTVGWMLAAALILVGVIVWSIRVVLH